MQKNQAIIKFLIGITLLATVFHLVVLLKIIPFQIVWGGRLQTEQDMYVFELGSILVNAFFIFVLLQKGMFIKSIFSNKAVSIILWIFFAVFLLNTIGNLLAKSTFEKLFTIVTLTNAACIWKINKTVKL